MNNEKFKNFQEKRMVIFREIVKRYWEGTLNSPADLDVLALEIKDRYEFQDTDIPFIKNHIRVALGQDPKEDATFSDELDIVRNSKKVKLPVVVKIDGPCDVCGNKSCSCETVGKYETDIYKRAPEPVIENGKCLSCGHCVTECDFGALADKIEFVPLIDLLKDKSTPVFAAVAPAIVGQFGDNVSMGQLRSALKYMGFMDMVEVALFADILTIKEALEFNHLIKSEKDFFLTSCCCPVWFNMVKKVYSDIKSHMSPSVSPMIAAGRILKRLYENARVVFISPCIAKKAEIKEPDLEGAIDFVINFRELKEIFNALNLNLESFPSDDKDQASLGGRMYARTGGVSFSVKTVVNRLEPTRVIKLKPKRVDGVQDCKKILDEVRKGELNGANFIEGMGCAGGCAGGPRTNIDVEKATRLINYFGEDSYILTPFDNMNVMKILEQFGIEKPEDLLKNEEMKKILTRE